MLLEFIIVAVILYIIDAYVAKPAPLQTIFRVFCALIGINYLCLFLGKSVGPFPLHLNW